MMTMETLRDAAFKLPPKLRDQWFEGRKGIRARVALSRITYEPHRHLPHVSWDDPEFVAQCAVYLAELHLEAQAAVNRLAGG